MNRTYLFVTLALSTIGIGCKSPPNHVETFRGPQDVVYTVETWEQYGAPSSDFTRVFAAYDGSKPSEKHLVMDGAYLLIHRIIWNSDDDVTICLSGGRVNSFRTLAILQRPQSPLVIYNHIDEHCPRER